jgi:release factor glutamine methyltransferase
LPDTYDLIVSNPPYVTEDEKNAMSGHVLNYEPGDALFVPGDDPLLYYRHIARLASEVLRDHGMVYLEINERFAREVSGLFSDAGFRDIQTVRDLNRKDRFISASR